MYLRIVFLLIFFFFTVRNVADNFSGFVKEPIADERILRRSSSSDRLRMLCLPTISAMYVSSKSDLRKEFSHLAL